MKEPQLGVYPKQFERKVVIRDGTEVFLRPIKKTDTEMWIELYRSLSIMSKYYRFFASQREPTPDIIKQYTDIDYINNFALVAIITENGQEKMVGVVRYVLDPPPETAELGVVVADAWQNRGLGTKMLMYILQIMIKRKIKKVHGDVFLENRGMLNLMYESGFKLTLQDSQGIRHFEFNL